MKKLRNPHPGIILKRDFLDKFRMSQNQLADNIYVPRNRIHAIIKGDRDITADTDIRLCRFFSLKEGYFLGLQNSYDIMKAKRVLRRSLLLIVPYKLYADNKLYEM